MLEINYYVLAIKSIEFKDYSSAYLEQLVRCRTGENGIMSSSPRNPIAFCSLSTLAILLISGSINLPHRVFCHVLHPSKYIWLSFFLSGQNKVALFKICSGQNKNNAMIHYLLWRLTTGRTTGTIELNFMLAGHTKFAPDQHFGTIKKCFSRTFVSSLSELSAVSTQAYWNLTLYVHCSSEIIVYLRYNLSDAPPLHSCNELPHHL